MSARRARLRVAPAPAPADARLRAAADALAELVVEAALKKLAATKVMGATTDRQRVLVGEERAEKGPPVLTDERARKDRSECLHNTVTNRPKQR